VQKARKIIEEASGAKPSSAEVPNAALEEPTATEVV
jgi:hypothetical protein